MSTNPLTPEEMGGIAVDYAKQELETAQIDKLKGIYLWAVEEQKQIDSDLARLQERRVRCLRTMEQVEKGIVPNDLPPQISYIDASGMQKSFSTYDKFGQFKG